MKSNLVGHFIAHSQKPRIRCQFTIHHPIPQSRQVWLAFVTIIGLGLAVAILRAASAASAQPFQNQQPSILNLQSAIPISITQEGFDPTPLTVTIGSVVAWINQTAQPVRLKSGEPQQVFLPLVMKNANSTAKQANFLAEPTAPLDRYSVLDDSFSTLIPPGGTFTHTFMTAGQHTYYLASAPSHTGLVVAIDTVEVCGTIGQDTEWAYATYVVVCNISVPSGVTLTVSHGAVVKLKSTIGIDVNGNLIATGSPAAPVVFTSYRDDTYGGDTNDDGSNTTPAPADWGEIVFRAGSQGELHNALVRYGGALSSANIYNLGGEVYLERVTSSYASGYGLVSLSTTPAGKVVVDNSVFSHNTADGLRIESSVLTMTNSLLSSNGQYGLVLLSVSQPVINTTEFTTNTVGAAYWAVDSLVMDARQVRNNTGSGNALNGIAIAGNLTGASVLSDTNPGFPYVLYGVAVLSGGELKLQAGTVLKVKDNSGIDVYGKLNVQGTSGSPVVITSLRDDSLEGDTNNNGSGNTPQPGSWGEIVFRAGSQGELHNALVRYGGANSSANLYNYGGEMHLERVTSSYAAGYGLVSLSTTPAGKVVVDNSVFSHNTADGLRMESGILTIQDSTFITNTSHGLSMLGTITTGQVLSSSFQGNSIGLEVTGNVSTTLSANDFTHNSNTGLLFSSSISPTILYNSFYSNTNYGLQNTASYTITAVSNWWGSSSGPTHASNPGGSGDKVSEYVIFKPWLAAKP
jgi:plastocyanin